MRTGLDFLEMVKLMNYVCEGMGSVDLTRALPSLKPQNPGSTACLGHETMPRSCLYLSQNLGYRPY